MSALSNVHELFPLPTLCYQDNGIDNIAWQFTLSCPSAIFQDNSSISIPMPCLLYHPPLCPNVHAHLTVPPLPTYTWVHDLSDIGRGAEKLGYSHGVPLVLSHANVESLQSSVGQETVKRAGHWPRS